MLPSIARNFPCILGTVFANGSRAMPLRNLTLLVSGTFTRIVTGIVSQGHCIFWYTAVAHDHVEECGGFLPLGLFWYCLINALTIQACWGREAFLGCLVHWGIVNCWTIVISVIFFLLLDLGGLLHVLLIICCGYQSNELQAVSFKNYSLLCSSPQNNDSASRLKKWRIAARKGGFLCLNLAMSKSCFFFVSAPFKHLVDICGGADDDILLPPFSHYA